MSKMFNVLGNLFKKHPFLTNSAVYGSLYVGAELSQQYLTKKVLVEKDSLKEDIDYATVGRYAVMGTVVYAPSLYIWYKWLDRTFPGTTKKIIVKKLFIDQFVLTPYLLTMFYIGMSWMEGKENLTLELKQKFLPTFQRSCMFWLPAQVFNFVLVPPKLRVIYMGVCGFIWVNILCWIKRQKAQTNKQPELTAN